MKFIYLFLLIIMPFAASAQSVQCIPFDDAMGAAMLVKSKVLAIYQNEIAKGEIDENLKIYISSINGSIIQCQQEMQSINKNLISEERKTTISRIVTDMSVVSENLDTIKDNVTLFESLDTLNVLTKELETIILNNGKKREK